MPTMYRRQRSPYVPLGVSQQGRRPELDYEPDESLDAASGILVGIVAALTMWACIALLWVWL